MTENRKEETKNGRRASDNQSSLEKQFKLVVTLFGFICFLLGAVFYAEGNNRKDIAVNDTQIKAHEERIDKVETKIENSMAQILKAIEDL